MRKKFYKKKAMALSQVLILILSTIAVSYAIGSSLGFVSADLPAGFNLCASPNCFTYGGNLYTITSPTTMIETQPGNGFFTLTQTNGVWSVSSSTTGYSGALSSANPGNINDLLTQAAKTYTPSPQVPSISSTAPTQLPSLQEEGYATGTPEQPPSLQEEGYASGSTPGSTTSGTPTVTVTNGPTLSSNPQGVVANWLHNNLGFSGQLANGIVNVAGAAAWAAAVYYGIGYLRDNLLHLSPGTTGYTVATATQFAAAGGTFGYLAANTLNTILGGAGLSSLAWGGIGAAAMLVYWLIFSKETKTDIVVFNNLPWQPPVGGNDCSVCGQNGIPCTSYQCASLGQACQLLNAQGTGEPLCTWVDPHDITPPTISFLGSVFSQNSGYSYQPINPPAEYPGDTGVQILYNGGDIPSSAALPIGITTDKASQCKIDIVRGTNFSNMAYPMIGGINGNEGLWEYNHTLLVPILQGATGIGVQTPGQTDLYIRCENANGYADIGAFVIQFTVSQASDHTAPNIIGTGIVSGSPVSFGTNYEIVPVYVNEPVTGCNWDHSDVNYNSMANSMDCSNANSTTDMNLGAPYPGTFTCLANLTGIKSNSVSNTNNFYFRCNDTSGNVDTQSYPFSLTGSQPLVISSVTPNATTITDSTQSVHVVLNVQTSAGANQGAAICYYDTTGAESDYVQFATTNSYQSSADLWLPAGSYTYYVKCVDAGGNAAYSSVNFNVQTVTTPPNVIRAYHDSAASTLDIQTDRNSSCVYDIVDCTYPFDQGIQMTTTDGITQSAPWVTDQTYYIKCESSFGNQPAPNTCSIVLSPSV